MVDTGQIVGFSHTLEADSCHVNEWNIFWDCTHVVRHKVVVTCYAGFTWNSFFVNPFFGLNRVALYMEIRQPPFNPFAMRIGSEQIG